MPAFRPILPLGWTVVMDKCGWFVDRGFLLWVPSEWIGAEWNAERIDTGPGPPIETAFHRMP